MVSLMIPLLCWTLCISSVSAEDQRNITSKPGQIVSLPCRRPDDKPVAAVEWRRSDLGKKYVLLYKDDRLYSENQHESFKDRVDLQDRQMKDRDVSLVLKNVTTDDNGTYECRVQNEGSLERNLIRIVNLEVSPPGNKDGGNHDRSVGLIVGLSFFIVAVVAGVLFLIYKKQSACFRKKTSDPAVEL